MILLLLVIFLAGCSLPLQPAAKNRFEPPIAFARAAQDQIISLVTAATATPVLLPTPDMFRLIPVTSVENQADINPLTGLPAPDPALLNRRPVMVKVSNYPVVGRPHAGLSYADLVFEYYIGEYINRFLAVYYSQDAPKIGPIRSGRLVDIQLTSMYQGVLAYGSADERVDAEIKKFLGDRSLAHTESPCPPICGFDPHSAAGTFGIRRR